MTIGLFNAEKEKVRECIKRLKMIPQEIISANIPDLEIANAEGPAIIRVGTTIFGERNYPDG